MLDSATSLLPDESDRVTSQPARYTAPNSHRSNDSPSGSVGSPGSSINSFLFIDGDHSEAGVEADFLRYGRWVRPGEAIALHDIARRQPVPEIRVHDLLRQVRATTGTLE